MAENTALVLTTEQVKKLSDIIDSAIDAEARIKNALASKVVEALDGTLAKITLNQLNKWVSPLINDDFKSDIQDAIDDCIDGDKDYEVAVEKAMALIGYVVDDVENLPDWSKELITTFLSLVKVALLILINK